MKCMYLKEIEGVGSPGLGGSLGMLCEEREGAGGGSQAAQWDGWLDGVAT